MLPRAETVRWRAVCALSTLLAVGGCGGGSPEARLDDYLSRLARPLDQAPPAPAPAAVPAPPRWEALQLPIEGGSIDGLDFLRLRGCALQRTVARRNSVLGRVAPPSQRLLMELEFLRLVGDCVTHLNSDGEPELAGLLADNAALKRRQLPALIFNATLGNEEYRDLWRRAPLLGDYPAHTSSAVIDALGRLNAAAQRWLNGDYAAQAEEFELLLAEVATGDGGELLAALALQAAYLDAGSTLLRDRAARGALCAYGLQPRSAPILRTVATRFFVGDVQPWSAAVAQRAHALLPPIRALERLLDDVLPDAYRQWRSERERRLARWNAAPRRHVEALQALLGSCFSEFAPAATDAA